MRAFLSQFKQKSILSALRRRRDGNEIIYTDIFLLYAVKYAKIDIYTMKVIEYENL